MPSSTLPLAFETARMLAARGEAAQASEVLDRLLEREPEHVSALLLKGQLQLEARDGEGALAFYERAEAGSAGIGRGLGRPGALPPRPGSRRGSARRRPARAVAAGRRATTSGTRPPST